MTSLSHYYQPTYQREMEEPMRYSCVCCTDRFNKGVRYSKDNDLLFCEGCVRDYWADKYLISLGLTLCQVFNVTRNEVEILK